MKNYISALQARDRQQNLTEKQLSRRKTRILKWKSTLNTTNKTKVINLKNEFVLKKYIKENIIYLHKNI